MRYFLIWLLLCFIWSTTWLAIKIGIADIPALPFAGLRFAIAATILFAARAAGGKAGISSVPKPLWRFLVLSGILNFAFNYGLVFWGEQYISAGLAALIGSMTPGFTFLFAHLLIPEERLSPLKVAGLALGILGVGVIFSDQLHLSGMMALFGSCALLASAFGAGLFGVWVKRKGGGLDPSLMAGWHMVFGCVPLLLIGTALYGNPLAFHWTLPAAGALLYLALVGSAVAFFLYYHLIRHVAVGSVSTISLIAPVGAVIVDRIVLHETLSLASLGGGALILLGTGLIVRPKLPLLTTATAD